MGLRQRFVDGLRRRENDHVLNLSPAELTQAAVEAVEASAGGLSLVQPLVRLPIGASDHDAEVAEQVQASCGASPCLTSAERGSAVAAGGRELESTWPVYHRLLTARTPFRAIASFPLRQSGGTVFAALDLFGTAPDWRPADDLPTVQSDVVDLLGMMLLGSILGRQGRPAWPGDDQARRRQQVWTSVGMVSEAAHVGDADAMAMLRAYAFSHDWLLDEVAAEMLSGQLLPETIAGSG